MTIEALALLRLSKASLPPAAHDRVTALDDGLLLRTGESFAREPEELSVVVRTLVGPLLDEHRDPRGIFFVPHVAAPAATTYEQVIVEVGEGGVWGPLVDAPGADDFQSLLGNLLGQLPSSLLATANAAAAGSPGAFEAMGAQLQGMLGSPAMSGLAAQLEGMLAQAPRPDAAGPAEGLAPALSAMLGDGGIDLGSPAFAALAENVRSELERDPARIAELAAQLFGKDEPDDEKPKK